jgi:hypothetical protein
MTPGSQRIRRVSDGVVASYIHDISTRHHGARADDLGHARRSLPRRDSVPVSQPPRRSIGRWTVMISSHAPRPAPS